ncbi:MAG: hypothetical protein J6Y32_01940 [Bacteroidales bacterium]|nr:hypothetical protein [Bacteroidales bacterium]
MKKLMIACVAVAMVLSLSCCKKLEPSAVRGEDAKNKVTVSGMVYFKWQGNNIPATTGATVVIAKKGAGDVYTDKWTATVDNSGHFTKVLPLTISEASVDLKATGYVDNNMGKYESGGVAFSIDKNKSKDNVEIICIEKN